MRSLEEIQIEIINKKNTYPSLSGLNSTSQTAIWRLWVFVVAFAIFIHESLWVRFQGQLVSDLSKLRPGTLRWYQEKCLLYQHGDILTYLDNKYQYALIDESKRIIKVASASENAGVLQLKVAKLSSQVVPLGPSEIAGFTSYMQEVKFAGTQLVVISTQPDILIFNCDIYYDPQVPFSVVFQEVTEAVESYLVSLPFNSILSLDILEGKVQDVKGVKEVALINAEAKPNNGSFTTFNATYTPQAGYMTLDPGSSIYNALNYYADV